MNKRDSKAGYIGAFALIIGAFALSIFDFTKLVHIYSLVLFSFLIMVIWEFATFKITLSISKRSNLNLFKSAISRFLPLFATFYVFYYAISNHYYFDEGSFWATRIFFDYLMILFLVVAIPYIFFTLKFLDSSGYEYNDYGILLLVFYKNIFLLFWSYINYKDPKRFISMIKNRRIKKVLLVFVVNFFFLTLMAKFLNAEFGAFHSSLQNILDQNGDFRSYYFLIYHLIFIVDISIGIIGYTIASRWLDNRTKSVDFTLSGWMVALICYPPLNSAIGGNFINYTSLQHSPLHLPEILDIAIMCLILISFFVYAWSSASLGFKFSNLTNRGIVKHGPYKFVRHPAYISKNISRWLENLYVFTNIWALLALAVWNLIYIFRGITEERHLNLDKEYNEYCKDVKWRFIPKLF